jgi:hypothetical protein
MSTKCAQIADAIKAYSDALDNLRKKVQQERSVHCQQLANVYAEAVATGSNKAFIDMLNQMMQDRTHGTELKMQMDALEWKEHETKTTRALGQDRGVLSGGASCLSAGAKRRKKQLKYCGCRSNAYHQNLLKKLIHDRTNQLHDLVEAQYHSIKLHGGEAPITKMLGGMVHDRKIFDARKTELDAAQWGALSKQVKGGGCGYMLSAGGCCVTGCQ